MKYRTLINLLEIALLIAVIAATFIALWASVHDSALLATVSWNG